MESRTTNPQTTPQQDETPARNALRERPRITISITPSTIWLTVGVLVSIVAVAFVVSMALHTIIVLLLAIIFGEAIRPLVAQLSKRGIPEPVAVLLIYAVGLATVALVMTLLLNPFIQDISALSNRLPAYVRQLQRTATDVQEQLRADTGLGQAVNALASSLSGAIQQSVPQLLSVPLTALAGIFGLFIDTVVMLTMTLFWLMATSRLRPFIIGLFPEEAQDTATSVLGEIGTSFGGYVRGELVSMLLIGVLTGLGLLILGVPYPLLLGVLAGLTELLPYLGPWISGAITVLVALVAVDPLKAIEALLLFVIIQQVEGNIVQPLVMSRAVHLDPLLVIVAVLIGINLLGILGAILAVPLTAAIQTLVVRVLAPAIRRSSRKVEALHAIESPPSAAAPGSELSPQEP